MANTPTFTFIGNQVINNTNAMVQLEGDATNGYYHNLTIEGNTFTDNEGDYDLLFIRNQRASKSIRNNRFFGNQLSGIQGDVFSGMTFALINSGTATVADNAFNQNGAMAEVFVQESSSGTTTLTGNRIAASGGTHFGAWLDLAGKAALQSSGNTFYSNYNTKDPWNTVKTDCVAAWGNGRVALTLDKWNAKTPKDGNDSLAAVGKQPEVPASTGRRQPSGQHSHSQVGRACERYRQNDRNRRSGSRQQPGFRLTRDGCACMITKQQNR